MSHIRKIVSLLATGAALALLGCGGGGSTSTGTQTTATPTPASIMTASLPAATEGTPYSETIQASGTSPLTFSVSSGSLPTGLSLASTGSITGTPMGPTGSSSFTVQVASGNSQSATQTLSIAVDPATSLTIKTGSLANGNQNAAYSATLQSSGGIAPVTWSIVTGTLPTGLSLNGNTGMVAGTPTLAGTFSLTVEAQDSSLPQQSTTQNLSLTINAGTLAITSTGLLNPMAGENYNQTLQFTATALPVTWSIVSGSLPTGLSLNGSTGAITGTPPVSAVGTSNFTVQLMDSTTPEPQIVTRALTLTVTTATACGTGSESLFSGQYAMQLMGFDASGPAGLMASFTADGTGKITAGMEDINSTASGALQTNVAVTTASSSYSIGADRRGCLTLVAGGVTRVFRFAAALISGGVSGGARAAEFDTTGSNTTGIIRLQTPANFSSGAVTGNYAFGANSPMPSAAGGGLFGAAGVLDLDGTTGAVTGSGDFNLNGSVDSGDLAYPGTPLAFTGGSYSIAADGRGTLSFNTSSGTIDLVMYVLNAGQLLMMSTDPQSASNPLFVVDAQLQTGTFTSATLNAASTLFGSGLTGTGSGSLVQAGAFTPDGNGNFTFSGDQNSGGTISTLSASGTYSVANSGRVLVQDTGSASPTLIFYMVSPNLAYVISTDKRAISAYAEPQGLPFTNATLSGTYSFGGFNPVVPANSIAIGSRTYDGSGNATGTFDFNQSGQLSIDNPLSETYAIAANGRIVTPSSGTTQIVGYVVYNGKAVVFDYTAGDPNPTMEIIEQ